MTNSRMTQLSVFQQPQMEITTQYGNISWSEYLQKEKDRIERNPMRVAEIRQGGMGHLGEIALYVNHVGAVMMNGRNYIERQGRLLQV